jgi:hypothetical protein
MYHFPDRGRNVPVQDWMSFWNPLRLMELTQPLYKNVSACDRVLRPGRADEAPSFQSGEKVRVRSATEILSTLDMSGRLNGAPFLNVMMPLIGAAGTVKAVMPYATVVLEFGAGGYWAWKTEWLASDGPAPQLAPRAEEAARRRLAALAADHPEA